MNKRQSEIYSREIIQRVSIEKPLKDAKFVARYVGSVGHEHRKSDEKSQLRFLGFSAKQIGALVNEKYSFSALPLSEQIQVWLKLYHTSLVHEELIMALAWMAHPKHRELTLSKPSHVFELQKRVDNWAISDTLSSLVARLVEADPERHLPQLRKWNTSLNPWERRQSLVGLYYYAASRTHLLPARLSLPFVENLIEDRHYFVQKAVGWTLREIYQVDRRAQLHFVNQNATRLSSTAFATAIEKYNPAEKIEMKSLRVRTVSARSAIDKL